MSVSVIDDFVQLVIYDHSVATGLKACKTDQVSWILRLPVIIFFQSQLGFSMLNQIQLA